MPLWNEFKIGRFRRLKDVHLQDLRTINLLVGPNNSGKTSVLEAMALAADPLNSATWVNVPWKREIKSARTPDIEVVKWLFPDVGSDSEDQKFTTTIELSGQSSGNEWTVSTIAQKGWQIPIEKIALGDELGPEDATLPILRVTINRVQSSGNGMTMFQLGSPEADFYTPSGVTKGYPIQFLTPVSHRTERDSLINITKAIDSGRKSQLENLLKQFDAAITSIEIVSPNGGAATIRIIRNKSESQPLSVQGDGLRRALMLASAATVVSGGVLLLDEIETAFHPKILGDVFNFLVKLCLENNVQLFATTHSLEALDAIMQGVGEEHQKEFAVFRLPPVGTDLAVRRFSGQTVSDMRYEGGLDLR